MRTVTKGDERGLGPNPPELRRSERERNDPARSGQPYASENEDYTADHIKGPEERKGETIVEGGDDERPDRS